MKKKRFLHLLTALGLCAAMLFGVTAMVTAEEKPVTYTITVPSGDDHTYSVYQIFTGTLDEATGTLSDIKAGKNFKTTETDKDAAAKTAAQTIEAGVTEGMKEQEKLALILPYADFTEAFGSVSKSAALSAVPGYYLLKDSVGAAQGEAVSLYIVKIVNNVEVNRKSGVPTIEKKVKNTNDKDGSASEWQDYADYDIGDKVPFQITGTLPENFDMYNSYRYVITDELSDGLTLVQESITVMSGENNIKNACTFASEGNKFTLTFENLKNVTGLTKDSTIVVEYSATLNDGAVIGGAGNENTAYLTFSNNPNIGYTNETTQTPEETVKVFTYMLEMKKTDKEGSALANAKFTLYKNVGGTFTAVGSEVSGAGTGKNEFVWSGLDAGEYRIEETATPTGYNTIKPVSFTVEAAYTGEDEAVVIDKLEVKNITDSDGALGKDSLTADKAAGKVSGSVKNIKGSILPTTGTSGLVILVAAVAAILVVVVCIRVKVHREN